ncbi:VOC family protein [Alteraurantiacibacter buctensis]|uniref:Lactoylglutathione lyase n=1 Tax=Alteraurantiacibacter buctensis TaxID=1503981 RepID=A0A844YZP6_9SPHN|nr:VOC family protein [Alteraurantiacibacter buctensis]MXO72672.1 lactoylglutathione lyase [Alteraurantiacibacter buctensis]
MPKMIFVNLPVTDLAASERFYAAIGFAKNPAFSDDRAMCMVWSDTIFVMIHSEGSWRRFTQAPLPAPEAKGMMLAINLDSRDEVDALVKVAGASGGTADINPPADHGFMYQRSIADPDGTIWEPFWMDPAFASGEPMPEDAQ